MKRYAIFFPQFHQVCVNDLAWGHGFTDWALVAAANAFDYWTRRSPACGFYDLARASDVQAQFDAAATAGLDGFGIYHYRFDDGPEIDAVERYLKTSNPPSGFKYFFIWANENWSRRWAGKDTEILKRLSISPTKRYVRDHVNYVTPYLESESYARFANRPMFVVYRPDTFEDADATISLYREEFRQRGVEPSIGYFIKNVSDVDYSRLFDFCYVFEPRLFFNCSGIRKNKFANAAFKASLRLISDERAEMVSERVTRLLNRGSRRYSFDSFMAYFSSIGRRDVLKSISCPIQNVITCGWNNAPRYRLRFTELEVPTPQQFAGILNVSLADAAYSKEFPLLCNAWNEWAEGAAIEPCKYLGDALLRTYVSATAAEKQGIDQHGFDMCRI